MVPSHFATGIGAPEGPICLSDGSMYVTEMSSDTCCVTKIDPKGGRHVIKKTGGRPNGLALDGDGLIWVAEALLRALICIDPEGREVKRLETSLENPFFFPNDVAFGPDGHIYMTDSGLTMVDFLSGQNFVEGFMDLPWDGRVYEIDPKTLRVLRTLDRGLQFANGIAFGPGNILYANASFPGEVYRYDIFKEAEPKRMLFGNVLQPDDRKVFKGPDGMAFGQDGRLYCTVYNQKNITVLDCNGMVAERLVLDGEAPTNIAFTLDGTRLMITEVSKGQVETLPAPCAGLPLFYPKTR
jgi:gluconolactonase